MQIQLLELIEGAKRAEGLTVIIDVFRAFSLECYLLSQGVQQIYPIGALDEAFALKAEHPEWLLIGERGGAMVEGCDFGNSPSSLAGMDLTGKTAIHSTSAGTQGIVNAAKATEIVTGALVNAAAVADYIRQKNPAKVSIVAMGNAGLTPTREDQICAEYIRAQILGEDYPIAEQVASLREHGGEHFFDPERQHIYPRADYAYCTRTDCFDFVIGVHRDQQGRLMTKRL